VSLKWQQLQACLNMLPASMQGSSQPVGAHPWQRV
jgi:hypothetical protein